MMHLLGVCLLAFVALSSARHTPPLGRYHVHKEHDPASAFAGRPAGHPIAMEHQSAFLCQVCKVFCNEFDEQFKSKAGDEPYDTAVHWARGNTSNYVWDEKHQILKQGRMSSRGAAVVEDIYEVLDNRFLTHYNHDVILHALHAAGHVQVPPRVPWAYCRRVFCVDRLGVCELDSDTTPGYDHMAKDYEHYRRHFDSLHMHSEVSHGDKMARRHRDYSEFHIDPATLYNDPQPASDQDAPSSFQGDL
jgi:hypothetical protein